MEIEAENKRKAGVSLTHQSVLSSLSFFAVETFRVLNRYQQSGNLFFVSVSSHFHFIIKLSQFSFKRLAGRLWKWGIVIPSLIMDMVINELK